MAELTVPAVRVWVAPPEPGPEVTAVRDRRGRLWQRGNFADWAIVPRWFEGPYRMSWVALFFECGPLTDASREVGQR